MTVSTIYKLAAEMSTRGNLPAGLKAANKQFQTMQSNLGSIEGRVANLGRSVGSGAFQTAAGIAKGAGAAGAVAAGAAAGMMAKAGLSANANLERMTNTIAGTLQLYNHSAGATNQIGANIKVAGQALRELNKIADSSPGELDDVSRMFQNMLPGARSVTGEMDRIMRLTQNLALFTPTLAGGDFITSGSQMGRILTGSAGAEMDTWKRLAPVILQVGQEIDKLSGKGKVFSKSMEAGEKLTLAFNKLSGGQRMALIEKAFERGGPSLAAMYKQSWEGASATAISSGKKVVAAVTNPIFQKIKAAAIGHTGQDYALLGVKRTEKMVMIAGTVGALIAKPVERMIERISQGIRYVQENTYAVVNRIYQGFQVAGGIIRAAAAFLLSRMILGAGIMAASAAGKVAGGAARGVRGAYHMGESAVRGVRNGTKAVRGFMDSFKGQSAISRGLGMATGFFKILGSVGMLIPMVLILGAAFALLAVPLLAAAGIAAYIASKWDELSASIVKGFNDGSLSIRPLIVAALILWRRLERLGEAFIGGQTGATLMQKAINMATSVVNGLSEGVAIMARVAAGMLRIVGQLMNAWNAAFGDGESPVATVSKRAQALMGEGMTGAAAGAMAMMEFRQGKLTQTSLGDDAIAMANKIEAAAKSWKATDIQSINPKDIASWTDSVTSSITGYFNKETKDPKTPKAPGVNIGNLYMNVDLRGEDPDRSLSALIAPLENMAKRPTSSGADNVGGMGG